MQTVPKTISATGIQTYEFKNDFYLGNNLRALYTYKQGSPKSMIQPKIPPVKLSATWIQFLSTKLITKMSSSSMAVKVTVVLETVSGETFGLTSASIFFLMTITQIEKAATFKKTQKETMQQMKSSLPWKSQLQQIRPPPPSCRAVRFSTKSLPNAITAEIGIASIVMAVTRKATPTKSFIWLYLVSCSVMPGSEWWNMNEKMRLEKILPKNYKLKTQLPPLGVNSWIPLFQTMIIIAPIIIRAIDTKRTETRIACMTLVFQMLLKEKAAPERKKMESQKQKEPTIGTSAKSLDKMLPVMMHLEMATPKRQTEIESTGMILHFSPYKQANCCTCPNVFICFYPSSLESSLLSVEIRLQRFSYSSVGVTEFLLWCSAIFWMDSPMQLAELQLRQKITSVRAAEKMKPALKKGSGIMIGPAPRSKLIVVKAALLEGWLKNFLSFSNIYYVLKTVIYFAQNKPVRQRSYNFELNPLQNVCL